MHCHSSFANNRIHRRLLPVVLLMGMISGCSLPLRLAPDAPGGVTGNPAALQLAPALATSIGQAPVGAVLTVGESPWGSQVEILIEDAYLAASGRECRKLKLMGAAAGSEHRELACQNAQGWESPRLVTEVVSGGVQR